MNDASAAGSPTRPTGRARTASRTACSSTSIYSRDRRWLIAALIAIPLGAVVGHTGRGRVGRSSLAELAARGAQPRPAVRRRRCWLGPRSPAETWPTSSPASSCSWCSPSRRSSPAPTPASRASTRRPATRPRAWACAAGEVLRQVELPCALPLMLSGVRCGHAAGHRDRDDRGVRSASVASGRYLIDGLVVSDYAQMAGGAILVAAARPGDGRRLRRSSSGPPSRRDSTGKFRNTGDNRAGCHHYGPRRCLGSASPTDRADDQREALV